MCKGINEVIGNTMLILLLLRDRDAVVPVLLSVRLVAMDVTQVSRWLILLMPWQSNHYGS